MSWTYPAGTAEVEGWKLIKASTRALAELAKPNKKSAANVSNEDLPRWTLHLMEAGYGDSRRAILLQKHKNNKSVLGEYCHGREAIRSHRRALPNEPFYATGRAFSLKTATARCTPEP